jgi:hypothetical protein
MRIPGAILLGLMAVAACRGPVVPEALDRSAHSRVEIGGQQVLGEPPMCEASGAVRAPWDPGLILVADNEISDRLFGFGLDAAGALVGQRAVPLPGGSQPQDIEALAVLSDKVLVVGSHGHSGDCRLRPERHRIAIVRWNEATGELVETGLVASADGWRERVATLEACLRGLFTRPVPSLAEWVCEALVAAEHAAPDEPCYTLDVEGAVGLPAAYGDRLWLGLRRPRITGRAVLLRLTETLDELRFDGVACLDVGDRGIRALTVHGDHLWAVLGPTAAGLDSSALWRAAIADLVPGAMAEGEIVTEGLPPSSEALVIEPPFVTVLSDGKEPDGDSGVCEEPAGQVVLRIQ